MKGGRSILESFHEDIDLNQDTSSHSAAMDRSAAWDNLLNPVENRLSNYGLPSSEGNNYCVDNASHIGRTAGGWDPGESSSRANIQGQLNANDLKIGPSWASSLNDCVMSDAGPADWSFERPDHFLHENISSGFTRNYSQRPLNIQGSISSHSPLNASSNGGYRGNGDNGWFNRGSGTSSNLYRSGRSQMDDFPAQGTTPDNHGPFPGNSGYMVQHHDGSGSSSSSWGLSCKRKAVEGNPSRPSSSGNLSVDLQVETVGRHSLPSRYNASSSLGNIPAPSMSLQGPGHQGQLNLRTGSGNRGGNYGFHPFNGSNEVLEASERTFSFRPDRGQREPITFDLSVAGPDVRNPNINSTHHPSRLVSTSDLPEMRAPYSRPLNLNNTPSRSHMMQVPGSARSLLPLGRNGSGSTSSGTLLGPGLFPGERDVALRDEVTFRSSHNNHEQSGFVSPPESMHMVQEPSGWSSFSRGSTGSSRNVSSNSRITPSSSSRTFPNAWMPHQNSASQNQQRIAEFLPWVLFPSVDPDPGVQRGHFSFFPSASSSSEEAVMSSGSSSGDLNQPYSRSVLMEVSGDDANSWRALAAASDGRQRIASEIRQVLTAMRRAENWRAEDYMLFHPFHNGAFEAHDRHRDLRLDVDSMTYEELLALEERIGNVNTGLCEEVIMHSMRQRKHQLFIGESSNSEPCCVCQEDYTAGDDIGILNCGHEFHTNCIKQWLSLKNICPICKMTALDVV
ncbi:OLC1v1000072C7 [Oldenlandia corymbosa var. corymbosa]|nr:OLC1v1000072C7 [Oldenlandia corymbosa var. corymbosa]